MIFAGAWMMHELYIVAQSHSNHFRLVAMTQRFYLNSKFNIKSSKYMYPRSLMHFNLIYFMFVVEDFQVRVKLDISKTN